jgi:hypothetical protein
MIPSRKQSGIGVNRLRSSDSRIRDICSPEKAPNNGEARERAASTGRGIMLASQGAGVVAGGGKGAGRLALGGVAEAERNWTDENRDPNFAGLTRL